VSFAIKLCYYFSHKNKIIPEERNLEVLKTISKEEVVDLFLKKVHPSSKIRSKLSVHMVSQKEPPKGVSEAAAEAFENLVHQAFPDLDVKAWKASIDNPTPSIVDFGKSWLPLLKSDEEKKLLAQLPGLVDQHPVNNDVGDYRKPGVAYIEDRKAFKDGLIPSVDPGPMVEWNDLPVPRF